MDMMNKKVKVVSGKFQGFEGVIVGDCKLADKWLIKLDEFNAIYADKKDVKEGDIERVLHINNQEVKFETNVDEEAIWVTEGNEKTGIHKTAIKMFDENNKEKSLDICILDYKIEDFRKQVHDLMMQKYYLQGIKIRR